MGAALDSRLKIDECTSNPREGRKRFCADIGAEPDGLLYACCIQPNPLWRIAVLVAQKMKLVAALDNELVEANLESFREMWTR
jgi:hypothetical protein